MTETDICSLTSTALKKVCHRTVGVKQGCRPCPPRQGLDTSRQGAFGRRLDASARQPVSGAVSSRVCLPWQIPDHYCSSLRKKSARRFVGRNWYHLQTSWLVSVPPFCDCILSSLSSMCLKRSFSSSGRSSRISRRWAGQSLTYASMPYFVSIWSLSLCNGENLVMKIGYSRLDTQSFTFDGEAVVQPHNVSTMSE